MIIQKPQEENTFTKVENNSKFLTTEELNELKQLEIASQELIVKFGQNEYQLQILKSQKEELIKELENLKIKETRFIQSTQTKYGPVNINTETGEITPLS